MVSKSDSQILDASKEVDKHIDLIVTEDIKDLACVKPQPGAS